MNCHNAKLEFNEEFVGLGESQSVDRFSSVKKRVWELLRRKHLQELGGNEGHEDELLYTCMNNLSELNEEELHSCFFDIVHCLRQSSTTAADFNFTNNLKENDELRKEIEQFEHQNKIQLSEILKLTSQISALDDSQRQYLSEIQDLKEKNSKLKLGIKKAKEIESQKEEMQSNLLAIEQDFEKLKNAKAELESRNSSLLVDLRILKERLQAVEIDAEKNKNEALKFMKCFTEEKQRNDDLRNKRNVAESTLSDVSYQYQRLMVDFKDISKSYNSLELECKVKESDLEKANNLIQMLWSDISTLEKKHKLEMLTFPFSTPNKSHDAVCDDNDFGSLKPSLCLEMRPIIDSSSELPSPICGKQILPTRNKKRKKSVKIVTSCRKIRKTCMIKRLRMFLKKDTNFLKFVHTELQKQRKFIEKDNIETERALRKDLKLTCIEDLLKSDQTDRSSLKIDPLGGGMCVLSSPTAWAESKKVSSDFQVNDIHDQVKAEINALKTQLVRSHALLSYLQMKEKASEMCIGSTAQSGRTMLFQQKSFDCQSFGKFSCVKRDTNSNSSRGSTPLHQSFHAQSCPTLVGDLTTLSKIQQTEPSDRNRTHDSEPENKVLSSKDIKNRFIPLHTESRRQRLSDSSTVAFSMEGIECGTCEVHSTQSSVPSSPFVRQRTNSFLSAVQIGQQNGDPISSPQLKPPEPMFPTKFMKVLGNESSQQTLQTRHSMSEEQNIENRANDDIGTNVKPPPRSMRRGSGAGSPNSLMCIPRCPAFDFSEQDDEHPVSTSIPESDSVRKNSTEDKKSSSLPQTGILCPTESGPKKKQTKSFMLMPEAMENSETESAKGSFEYESQDMLLVATETPPPAIDAACPSLPNAVLTKLGLSKDSSSQLVESLDAHELESKFLALSLAFKTDQSSLARRLEIHKRQRDMSEKDVEEEIKAMKSSLKYLHMNASNSEIRDLIASIQNHVDIITMATSKVSARSETYGAVKQEEKISLAFEVIFLHVENLKRVLDKEHSELEDAKNMLEFTSAQSLCRDDAEKKPKDETKKSMKAVSMAIGSLKTKIQSHLRLFPAAPSSVPMKSSRSSNSWNSGLSPCWLDVPDEKFHHSSNSDYPNSSSDQRQRHVVNGNGGRCFRHSNLFPIAYDAIPEEDLLEEEKSIFSRLLGDGISSFSIIRYFLTFVCGAFALLALFNTVYPSDDFSSLCNFDVFYSLFDMMKSMNISRKPT